MVPADKILENQRRRNKLKDFVNNKDTTPAIEVVERYVLIKFE